MEIIQEDILQQLSEVVHPEYERNIVDLEMVGNLKVSDTEIAFQLLLKRQRDPFSSSVKKACEKLLASHYPNVNIKIIALYKEQQTAPKPVKDISKQEFALKDVKHVVAIASGKGGVGKSTVASNLAVTLARKGLRIGLIDADIYGPSQPKMFGIEDFKPQMASVEGYDLIDPAVCFGLKMLSIGFFVDPNDALIWRAPMAVSALKQIVGQTHWGELDFLLVDLPPGTGDVHLTMIQELGLEGAIIVTTPQPVALADAVKGINMFRQEEISIKIYGIVENMAWFTPEELPENKYYIFGEGGGKALAEDMELPLLAQIPIVQSIREGGDSGVPVVVSNAIQTKAFDELAENFLKQIEL